MTYNAPIIRLEIEGVKHAILHHLQGHSQDLERMIEKHLDEFDFEAHVKAAVNEFVPIVLKESISRALESRRGELAEAIAKSPTITINTPEE